VRLDDPVNNVDLAYFHAGQLQQMRSLAPFNNIKSALEAQFGQPITAQLVVTNPIYPAYFIGGTPSRKIIYIDGVTFAAQATNIMDGYNNGGGPTNTNGFNPYFQNRAQQIVTTLTTTTLAQAEFVDVVGYSAGGAIACHVVDRLRTMGSLYKMRIMTFGSPRAGDEVFAARLARVAIGRWFNADDPIPLIPPRLTDVAILPLLIPLIAVLRYASFVHTHGGIQINADGSTQAEVLPSVASVNPSASLATWYFGQEGDPNNPHGLNQYRSRLLTFSDAASSARVLNVAEGRVEAPREQDRRQANQRELQVAGEIQAIAARQNAFEPAVKDSVLFKAVRIGRTWCVQFGGQIVVYAGNPKRARHLARAGNDFLRSLPKQAVVDPETILSQMTSFFNQAVQPGGPVNPPINVGL
jgi:hypothetical protein